MLAMPGQILHVTPPRDVPKPKTAAQRKQRLERILKALDLKIERLSHYTMLRISEDASNAANHHGKM